MKFSGDLAIYVIGWLTNFLKTPVQILVNQFFQPIVNVVINDIIIPDFLSNGLFHLGTVFNGKKDVLVVDLTLPQAPVFFNQTMDVYSDAAVYF